MARWFHCVFAIFAWWLEHKLQKEIPNWVIKESLSFLLRTSAQNFCSELLLRTRDILMHMLCPPTVWWMTCRGDFPSSILEDLLDHLSAIIFFSLPQWFSTSNEMTCKRDHLSTLMFLLFSAVVLYVWQKESGKKGQRKSDNDEDAIDPLDSYRRKSLHVRMSRDFDHHDDTPRMKEANTETNVCSYTSSGAAFCVKINWIDTRYSR